MIRYEPYLKAHFLNFTLNLYFYFIFQVSVKIPFGDKELSAVISLPKRTSWQGCGVILTHGAGGDMFHEHLEVLARHLCNAGILCLRFTMKTPNFKYRVKCFTTVVVSR
jgi:hypothetical protein